MIRSIKIRIYPNKTQSQIIEQTLGTLRYLWNTYLGYNKLQYERYKNNEIDKKDAFVSAYDFNKLINHEFDRNKYSWIFDISSKARADMLNTVELAYKRFFKGKSSFPKFKSKKSNPVKSFFFIKDGIRIKNNRLWIPVLHYLKYSENGFNLEKFLSSSSVEITSGRIVKDNYDRYFVILLTKISIPKSEPEYYTDGLGIDLGIKNYATIYDGNEIFTIRHPWKDNNSRLSFYQDKINNLLRVISTKVEINKKKEGNTATAYHPHNIQKLWTRVRKYRKKIHDYMDDFLKKLCNTITAKTKPMYITIEKLDITELLTDSKLSTKQNDRISKSNWYKFREILTYMTKTYNIELRMANKYYPSSKKCHICGHKNDISLANRTITCSKCGNEYDRDENAAINLYNLKKYTVK